jgi:hypothetical protein
MVTILSIMPGMVSGSLTRLVGAFFCFDTICSPLVLHTWENISDRTEVRWVLIGLLLDFIYLSTAALLNLTSFIGFMSIGFIFLVCVGDVVALYLGIILIFTSGPWDKYFKRTLVGDSGRSIRHPMSRFPESSARFIVQLILFLVNRFVRSLLAVFLRLDSPKNSQYSQETKAYVYQELKGERTIRLLRIRKGWPFQKIECQFKNVQLGTSESYEAVSYVWGDLSRAGSILVDGGHLTITKSAYDIIHRRRSAWMDQLIWIDQVCINQTDSDEKASQVQMMEHIYKEAVRVTAFLGESAHAHLVQALFAELHFKMEGLEFSAELLKAQYLRESKRPQWNALAEFFSNPWFRRVWIIQEVAFAQELHLFYGNVCMDWEYVLRATDVLCDRHMLEAFRPSDQDNSYTLLDALIGLRNVDAMLQFRGDIDYKRKFDLALALKTGSSFGSTDPRDKVYALLGLTTDNSKKLIKPNYSEDHVARDVYTDAMLFVLAEGASPIDALTGAGIGFERSMNDLPSWVPDWSHTTQIQMLDKLYTAGTRYKATINLVPRGRLMITLGGLQFDQVKHLGAVYEIAENTSYMERRFWYAEAEALATAHTRDTYHNGEPRLEAFIRTMLGNHASYGPRKRPSAEQCYSDYQALKAFHTTCDMLMEPLFAYPIANELHADGFFEQPRDINARASRFLHFSGAASGRRRFCITGQGRMAIMPPRSLPDDIICIIKGACMPFVLRQASSGDLSVYNLVGCCYVHGVMDGEIEVQEAQTFVLA